MHAAQQDAGAARALRALASQPVPVEAGLIVGDQASPPAGQGMSYLLDSEGLARARYDAADGAAYLIRPDQHVVGRWRKLDPEAVRAAVARASGLEQPAALSLAGA